MRTVIKFALLVVGMVVGSTSQLIVGLGEECRLISGVGVDAVCDSAFVCRQLSGRDFGICVTRDPFTTDVARLGERCLVGVDPEFRRPCAGGLVCRRSSTLTGLAGICVNPGSGIDGGLVVDPVRCAVDLVDLVAVVRPLDSAVTAVVRARASQQALVSAFLRDRTGLAFGGTQELIAGGATTTVALGVNIIRPLSQATGSLRWVIEVISPPRSKRVCARDTKAVLLADTAVATGSAVVVSPVIDDVSVISVQDEACGIDVSELPLRLDAAAVLDTPFSRQLIIPVTAPSGSSLTVELRGVRGVGGVRGIAGEEVVFARSSGTIVSDGLGGSVRVSRTLVVGDLDGRVISDADSRLEWVLTLRRPDGTVCAVRRVQLRVDGGLDGKKDGGY